MSKKPAGEIIDALNEWKERQKQIDDMIKAAKETMQGAAKAVTQFTLAMESLKEASDEIRISVAKLRTDYDALKQSLQENKWLKIFGVKIK